MLCPCSSGTAYNVSRQSEQPRSVARKFSIGWHDVCAGGIDILKINKTPQICGVLYFNLGAWSFVWGLSSPKSLVATGLEQTVPEQKLAERRLR